MGFLTLSLTHTDHLGQICELWHSYHLRNCANSPNYFTKFQLFIGKFSSQTGKKGFFLYWGFLNSKHLVHQLKAQVREREGGYLSRKRTKCKIRFQFKINVWISDILWTHKRAEFTLYMHTTLLSFFHHIFSHSNLSFLLSFEVL